MTENKLKEYALNLSETFPASPRETLAGYVIAKRALDKCRATEAGTNGEYHFDCPLDRIFFEFAEISGDAFKEFVATGACDDKVAEWIEANAKKRERGEIIQWNNNMRSMRPCDLPIGLQEYLEGYIPEVVPSGKIVYVFFDVYDLEEGRI